METRFNEWQENYESALDLIKHYLEPDNDRTPAMNGLVEWMINTDSNPYAYLPLEWSGSLNNATSFVKLLAQIHHALYDDGCIAFVTVNGEPRIVFANPYEDGFNDCVITANDRALSARRAEINGSDDINVTVLDIDPGEFGAVRDAYETARLKRGFAFEVARFGLDFALKNARRSKLFNPKWVEECAEQIDEYRKVLLSALDV